MYSCTYHNEDRIPFHTFVVLKVDDTEALPNYPYRDDALLIFEVIYDYVREVLEAFYGEQKIEDIYCHHHNGPFCEEN